jgi:hypothetical protein
VINDDVKAQLNIKKYQTQFFSADIIDELT